MCLPLTLRFLLETHCIQAQLQLADVQVCGVRLPHSMQRDLLDAIMLWITVLMPVLTICVLSAY